MTGRGKCRTMTERGECQEMMLRGASGNDIVIPPSHTPA